MKIVETPLKGAFLVDLEKIEDYRGFFARLYCLNEMKAAGIHKPPVQINTSYSSRKGTLRGLHYQVEPFGETKMIRCIRGAMYDVIIDLRENSETFCQWYGVELSAQNRTMLIVPEGFAHACQSQVDNSEILYPVTEFYSPEHERGVRWDDPLFNIQWPISHPIVSEKDQSFPDFKV